MSKTVRIASSSDEATPTIADARRALAARTDITEARRRRFNASLSGIARVCRADPSQEEAVPLDCVHLNKRLFAGSPATFGFTKRRFSCIVSDARVVMRMLSVHADDIRGELSPAWAELVGHLRPYRATALAGFTGFCTLVGLEPHDVEPTTLSRFERWLETETICRDPAKRARETASNWNYAAEHIAQWPAVRFERDRMRDEFTPKLSDLPTELQKEVSRYLQRLRVANNEDLYPDDVDTTPRSRGALRPLKRRTIDAKQWLIRVAAGALIRTGVDAGILASLSVLVEPENVRAIIRFLRDRTGKQRSGYLLNVVECIRQIAKYHCRVSGRELEVLSQLVRAVRPPQQYGMTEKNADRLRQIIEPRTRGLLINLPLALAERARKMPMSKGDATRLIAYAVALEIELRFAFRRANLAALHLDENLRYADPQRTCISAISIPAEDTKGDSPIDLKVPLDCANFLSEYIRNFRPHVASPANRYLFAGPDLKPRSAHELAIGLCKLIEREIGVTINLHLLRHFAGWRYLERHPGRYEVVQQMLGHKKVETTIRFYMGLEAMTAARHVDETFLAERAELAAQAEIDRRFGPRRHAQRRARTMEGRVFP